MDETIDELMATLPDEVRAEIDRPKIQQQETLNALGIAIAKLRDEAIAARKESGIEDTWRECEEAYYGVDDVNRHEFAGAKWIKPMTMDGPLIKPAAATDGGEHRATVFIKVTARYVDAGAAKVCEIALPMDGKPFTLKPTPVPEVSDLLDDKTPAQEVTGQPMPGAEGAPVTVDELAKHALSKIEQKAEKAAKRIHDWMVEYKHGTEMRKVVFDMARLGVGVIKGPTPEIRRARVVREVASQDAGGKAGQVYVVETVEKTKPAARWIDVWNFYPAPGCGEDIHSGGYCVERDVMLPLELSRLAETDGGGAFIADAIKKVLDEGPGKSYGENGEDKKKHKSQFEVWHFYGAIKRSDFAAANPEQAADVGKGAPDVWAQVTIVNDTVIRAILTPLDSRKLPFRAASWRRRKGHWAGMGVAEQVRGPQRIVNSGVRAVLNNAAKAAGSQVVMMEGAVEPANKDPRITPDKLWLLMKDSGIDDVRKAFAAFEWPSRVNEIMQIVEFGFRSAEEHSSIPLITQGQSGDTTPDTFGGQQLQDNNANQLLRDVGFGLNDNITTPLVDDFYEWLLLDPDVPNGEKGDFQVDTSGALAIIEKALQDQTILAMGGMVSNRAFKIDPAKWFEAWARSKRLTPSEFQYSEEDWAKIQKEPPPVAPQVQAAQIRAEAQVQVAQSRDQLQAQRNQADVDRDTAYNESLARRDEIAAERAREELSMRWQLALLEYAKQERITLQEAKTRLAETTMKLQVQRELAGTDGRGPQVDTPPTEPPGRAEDGKAYQQ